MTRVIHVAHSPDSDDAFMFYALAEGLVETDGIEYVHELQDIETLNQRALRARTRSHGSLHPRIRIAHGSLRAAYEWRVDG